MKSFYIALLAVSATFAQMNPVEETIQSARSGSPQFKSNLLRDIPALSQAARAGYVVWGQDFLFAVNSAAAVKAPTLMINEGAPLAMTRVEGTDYWYRLEKMRTGVTYSYQFTVDGKPLAARADLTGFNPDSYARAGVPQGKVSEKFTIVSKLYDGMKADYWIYASPGVEASKPAPLMVWQDGQGLIGRNSSMRLFTVTENLIAQKLLPPMVYVLIAPGFTPDNKALRAIQYDTVTDRYPRFLMEEAGGSLTEDWSFAEPSSGAGAVAMLVSDRPHVFQIDVEN